MGGQLITPGYWWGQGSGEGAGNLAQSSGNIVQPYNNPPAEKTYLPKSQVSFQFWQKPVYQAPDGTYMCPGVDGPTYAANEWDYIALGNSSFTPGICRVTLKKERDKQKKKPVGSDGARITFHGVDPAEFDVELVIWTPEQLRQLAILWPTLFPRANKGAPPVFDVHHPLFSIHDVKSCQFSGASGPDIGPDRKGVFKMQAVEFIKPSKKKATSTGVAPIGSILDAGAYPTPGSNAANTRP